MKSDRLDEYTSTGKKFWLHEEKLQSYKERTGYSIISTHISPEGSCNLNCSYCSVKKRKKNFRIELDVIKDYVEKLISRGLKAVILTGGGEPLLYPKINELVYWLKYEKNLELALITNGTQSERLKYWDVFEWIRVSINIFDNWMKEISLPIEKIPLKTTIGCSFIDENNSLAYFNKKISKLLYKLRAEYCRILPNCLEDQETLLQQHEEIKILLKKIPDKRFFHQFKIHGNPNSEICHQSYFRPYLSEVDGGTVFPCDSLVLNEKNECFDHKYKICKPHEILDFLDFKIFPNFNPIIDCQGCVFYQNIRKLDEWLKTGKKEDIDFNINHKKFV